MQPSSKGAEIVAMADEEEDSSSAFIGEGREGGRAN
jgi:hypothetical protein